MKRSRWIKLSAMMLTGIFSFNTVVMSNPDLLHTVQIPATYGRVKEKWVAPLIGASASPALLENNTQKMVYLLQDAHDSFDAQYNIGKMIHSVIEQAGDASFFIGIEGARGPVDVNDLRTFPIPELRETVSRQMIREGYLTAAEYAAITAKQPVTVWGLEDEKLFKQNYATFVAIKNASTEIEHALTALQNTLNYLTDNLYNARIQSFRKNEQAFDEQKILLADYLAEIMSLVTSPMSTIDVYDYPNIQLFSELLRGEARIDMTQLDYEIAELEQLTGLLVNTDDNRTTYETLTYVWNEAKKLDPQRVETCRMIPQKIACLQKTALFDHTVIMSEINRIEQAIKKSMAISRDEEMLIQCEYYYELLAKLLRLRAIHDDLAVLDSVSESSVYGYLRDALNEIALRYGYAISVADAHERIDRLCNEARRFYQEAAARNETLITNLLKGMDRTQSAFGVLVSGGFHTHGLATELKRRHIAYSVISPHIRNLNDTAGYMQRMMRTPNDKSGIIARYVNESEINGLMTALYGDYGKNVIRERFTDLWSTYAGQSEDWASLVYLLKDNPRVSPEVKKQATAIYRSALRLLDAVTRDGDAAVDAESMMQRMRRFVAENNAEVEALRAMLSQAKAKSTESWALKKTFHGFQFTIENRVPRQRIDGLYEYFGNVRRYATEAMRGMQSDGYFKHVASKVALFRDIDFATVEREFATHAIEEAIRKTMYAITAGDIGTIRVRFDEDGVFLWQGNRSVALGREVTSEQTERLMSFLFTVAFHDAVLPDDLRNAVERVLLGSGLEHVLADSATDAVRMDKEDHSDEDVPAYRLYTPLTRWQRIERFVFTVPRAAIGTYGMLFFGSLFLGFFVVGVVDPLTSKIMSAYILFSVLPVVYKFILSFFYKPPADRLSFAFADVASTHFIQRYFAFRFLRKKINALGLYGEPIQSTAHLERLMRDVFFYERIRNKMAQLDGSDDALVFRWQGLQHDDAFATVHERVNKRQYRDGLGNKISFEGLGYLRQLYIIQHNMRILSALFPEQLPNLPDETDYYCPRVSIIVPTFNEGEDAAKAILTTLNSGYPLDRLEVVVVNDQSTDSGQIFRGSRSLTGEVIEVVSEPFYDNVRNIEHSINSGKLEGMVHGVRQARGDFVVFIDSDTSIHPDAVYKLVQPMVDTHIGAVAGYAKVANRSGPGSNMLTKMQAAWYFIMNDIIKAAESTMGNVSCCPGALSAFRKELLCPVHEYSLLEFRSKKELTLLTDAMLGDVDGTFLEREFRDESRTLERFCQTLRENSINNEVRDALLSFDMMDSEDDANDRRITFLNNLLQSFSIEDAFLDVGLTEERRAERNSLIGTSRDFDALDSNSQHALQAFNRAVLENAFQVTCPRRGKDAQDAVFTHDEFDLTSLTTARLSRAIVRSLKKGRLKEQLRRVNRKTNTINAANERLTIMNRMLDSVYLEDFFTQLSVADDIHAERNSLLDGKTRWTRLDARQKRALRALNRRILFDAFQAECPVAPIGMYFLSNNKAMRDLLTRASSSNERIAALNACIRQGDLLEQMLYAGDITQNVLNDSFADYIRSAEEARIALANGRQFDELTATQQRGVTQLNRALLQYRLGAYYHLNLIDEFSRARFLDIPETLSDDRFLTELARRPKAENAQVDIVYHRDAIGDTNVPDEWKGYTKQQKRWGIAGMRYTIFEVPKWLWKRTHKVAALLGYLEGLVALTSPFVILYQLHGKLLLTGLYYLNASAFFSIMPQMNVHLSVYLFPVFYLVGVGLSAAVFASYHMAKDRSKDLDGRNDAMVFLYILAYVAWYGSVMTVSHLVKIGATDWGGVRFSKRVRNRWDDFVELLRLQMTKTGTRRKLLHVFISFGLVFSVLFSALFLNYREEAYKMIADVKVNTGARLERISKKIPPLREYVFHEKCWSVPQWRMSEAGVHVEEDTWAKDGSFRVHFDGASALVSDPVPVEVGVNYLLQYGIDSQAGAVHPTITEYEQLSDGLFKKVRDRVLPGVTTAAMDPGIEGRVGGTVLSHQEIFRVSDSGVTHITVGFEATAEARAVDAYLSQVELSRVSSAFGVGDFETQADIEKFYAALVKDSGQDAAAVPATFTSFDEALRACNAVFEKADFLYGVAQLSDSSSIKERIDRIEKKYQAQLKDLSLDTIAVADAILTKNGEKSLKRLVAENYYGELCPTAEKTAVWFRFDGGWWSQVGLAAPLLEKEQWSGMFTLQPDAIQIPMEHTGEGVSDYANQKEVKALIGRGKHSFGTAGSLQNFDEMTSDEIRLCTQGNVEWLSLLLGDDIDFGRAFAMPKSKDNAELLRSAYGGFPVVLSAEADTWQAEPDLSNMQTIQIASVSEHGTVKGYPGFWDVGGMYSVDFMGSPRFDRVDFYPNERVSLNGSIAKALAAYDALLDNTLVVSRERDAKTKDTLHRLATDSITSLDRIVEEINTLVDRITYSDLIQTGLGRDYVASLLDTRNVEALNKAVNYAVARSLQIEHSMVKHMPSIFAEIEGGTGRLTVADESYASLVKRVLLEADGTFNGLFPSLLSRPSGQLLPALIAQLPQVDGIESSYHAGTTAWLNERMGEPVFVKALIDAFHARLKTQGITDANYMAVDQETRNALAWFSRYEKEVESDAVFSEVEFPTVRALEMLCYDIMSDYIFSETDREDFHNSNRNPDVQATEARIYEQTKFKTFAQGKAFLDEMVNGDMPYQIFVGEMNQNVLVPSHQRVIDEMVTAYNDAYQNKRIASYRDLPVQFMASYLKDRSSDAASLKRDIINKRYPYSAQRQMMKTARLLMHALYTDVCPEWRSPFDAVEEVERVLHDAVNHKTASVGLSTPMLSVASPVSPAMSSESVRVKEFRDALQLVRELQEKGSLSVRGFDSLVAEVDATRTPVSPEMFNGSFDPNAYNLGTSSMKTASVVADGVQTVVLPPSLAQTKTVDTAVSLSPRSVGKTKIDDAFDATFPIIKVPNTIPVARVGLPVTIPISVSGESTVDFSTYVFYVERADGSACEESSVVQQIGVPRVDANTGERWYDLSLPSLAKEGSYRIVLDDANGHVYASDAFSAVMHPFNDAASLLKKGVRTRVVSPYDEVAIVSGGSVQQVMKDIPATIVKADSTVAVSDVVALFMQGSVVTDMQTSFTKVHGGETADFLLELLPFLLKMQVLDGSFAGGAYEGIHVVEDVDPYNPQPAFERLHYINELEEHNYSLQATANLASAYSVGARLAYERAQAASAEEREVWSAVAEQAFQQSQAAWVFCENHKDRDPGFISIDKVDQLELGSYQSAQDEKIRAAVELLQSEHLFTHGLSDVMRDNLVSFVKEHFDHLKERIDEMQQAVAYADSKMYQSRWLDEGNEKDMQALLRFAFLEQSTVNAYGFDYERDTARKIVMQYGDAVLRAMAAHANGMPFDADNNGLYGFGSVQRGFDVALHMWSIAHASWLDNALAYQDAYRNAAYTMWQYYVERGNVANVSYVSGYGERSPGDFYDELFGIGSPLSSFSVDDVKGRLSADGLFVGAVSENGTISSSYTMPGFRAQYPMPRMHVASNQPAQPSISASAFYLAQCFDADTHIGRKAMSADENIMPIPSLQPTGAKWSLTSGFSQGDPSGIHSIVRDSLDHWQVTVKSGEVEQALSPSFMKVAVGKKYAVTGYLTIDADPVLTTAANGADLRVFVDGYHQQRDGSFIKVESVPCDGVFEPGQVKYISSEYIPAADVDYVRVRVVATSQMGSMVGYVEGISFLEQVQMPDSEPLKMVVSVPGPESPEMLEELLAVFGAEKVPVFVGIHAGMFSPITMAKERFMHDAQNIAKTQVVDISLQTADVKAAGDILTHMQQKVAKGVVEVGALPYSERDGAGSVVLAGLQGLGLGADAVLYPQYFKNAVSGDIYRSSCMVMRMAGDATQKEWQKRMMPLNPFDVSAHVVSTVVVDSGVPSATNPVDALEIQWQEAQRHGAAVLPIVLPSKLVDGTPTVNGEINYDDMVQLVKWLKEKMSAGDISLMTPSEFCAWEDTLYKPVQQVRDASTVVVKERDDYVPEYAHVVKDVPRNQVISVDDQAYPETLKSLSGKRLLTSISGVSEPLIKVAKIGYKVHGSYATRITASYPDAVAGPDFAGAEWYVVDQDSSVYDQGIVSSAGGSHNERTYACDVRLWKAGTYRIVIVQGDRMYGSEDFSVTTDPMHAFSQDYYRAFEDRLVPSYLSHATVLGKDGAEVVDALGNAKTVDLPERFFPTGSPTIVYRDVIGIFNQWLQVYDGVHYSYAMKDVLSRYSNWVLAMQVSDGPFAGTVYQAEFSKKAGYEYRSPSTSYKWQFDERVLQGPYEVGVSQVTSGDIANVYAVKRLLFGDLDQKPLGYKYADTQAYAQQLLRSYLTEKDMQILQTVNFDSYDLAEQTLMHVFQRMVDNQSLVSPELFRDLMIDGKVELLKEYDAIMENAALSDAELRAEMQWLNVRFLRQLYPGMFEKTRSENYSTEATAEYVALTSGLGILAASQNNEARSVKMAEAALRAYLFLQDHRDAASYAEYAGRVFADNDVRILAHLSLLRFSADAPKAMVQALHNLNVSIDLQTLQRECAQFVKVNFYYIEGEEHYQYNSAARDFYIRCALMPDALADTYSLGFIKDQAIIYLFQEAEDLLAMAMNNGFGVVGEYTSYDLAGHASSEILAGKTKLLFCVDQLARKMEQGQGISYDGRYYRAAVVSINYLFGANMFHAPFVLGDGMQDDGYQRVYDVVDPGDVLDVSGEKASALLPRHDLSSGMLVSGARYVMTTVASDKEQEDIALGLPGYKSQDKRLGSADVHVSGALGVIARYYGGSTVLLDKAPTTVSAYADLDETARMITEQVAQIMQQKYAKPVQPEKKEVSVESQAQPAKSLSGWHISGDNKRVLRDIVSVNSNGFSFDMSRAKNTVTPNRYGVYVPVVSRILPVNGQTAYHLRGEIDAMTGVVDVGINVYGKNKNWLKYKYYRMTHEVGSLDYRCIMPKNAEFVEVSFSITAPDGSGTISDVSFSQTAMPIDELQRVAQSYALRHAQAPAAFFADVNKDLPLVVQIGNGQSIDLRVIAKIESDYQPWVTSVVGAAGITQNLISGGALDEYNVAHPHAPYSGLDMYDPVKCLRVSHYYFSTVLPSLLKDNNLPVTVETALWAYNLGWLQVQRAVQEKAEGKRELIRPDRTIHADEAEPEAYVRRYSEQLLNLKSGTLIPSSWPDPEFDISPEEFSKKYGSRISKSTLSPVFASKVIPEIAVKQYVPNEDGSYVVHGITVSVDTEDTGDATNLLLSSLYDALREAENRVSSLVFAFKEEAGRVVITEGEEIDHSDDGVIRIPKEWLLRAGQDMHYREVLIEQILVHEFGHESEFLFQIARDATTRVYGALGAGEMTASRESTDYVRELFLTWRNKKQAFDSGMLDHAAFVAELQSAGIDNLSQRYMTAYKNGSDYCGYLKVFMLLSLKQVPVEKYISSDTDLLRHKVESVQGDSIEQFELFWTMISRECAMLSYTIDEQYLPKVVDAAIRTTVEKFISFDSSTNPLPQRDLRVFFEPELSQDAIVAPFVTFLKNRGVTVVSSLEELPHLVFAQNFVRDIGDARVFLIPKDAALRETTMMSLPVVWHAALQHLITQNTALEDERLFAARSSSFLFNTMTGVSLSTAYLREVEQAVSRIPKGSSVKTDDRVPNLFSYDGIPFGITVDHVLVKNLKALGLMDYCADIERISLQGKTNDDAVAEVAAYLMPKTDSNPQGHGLVSYEMRRSHEAVPTSVRILAENLVSTYTVNMFADAEKKEDILNAWKSTMRWFLREEMKKRGIEGSIDLAVAKSTKEVIPLSKKEGLGLKGKGLLWRLVYHTGESVAMKMREVLFMRISDLRENVAVEKRNKRRIAMVTVTVLALLIFLFPTKIGQEFLPRVQSFYGDASAKDRTGAATRRVVVTPHYAGMTFADVLERLGIEEDRKQNAIKLLRDPLPPLMSESKQQEKDAARIPVPQVEFEKSASADLSFTPSSSDDMDDVTEAMLDDRTDLDSNDDVEAGSDSDDKRGDSQYQKGVVSIGTAQTLDNAMTGERTTIRFYGATDEHGTMSTGDNPFYASASYQAENATDVTLSLNQYKASLGIHPELFRNEIGVIDLDLEAHTMGGQSTGVTVKDNADTDDAWANPFRYKTKLFVTNGDEGDVFNATLFASVPIAEDSDSMKSSVLIDGRWLPEDEKVADAAYYVSFAQGGHVYAGVKALADPEGNTEQAGYVYVNPFGDGFYDSGREKDMTGIGIGGGPVRDADGVTGTTLWTRASFKETFDVNKLLVTVGVDGSLVSSSNDDDPTFEVVGKVSLATDLYDTAPKELRTLRDDLSAAIRLLQGGTRPYIADDFYDVRSDKQQYNIEQALLPYIFYSDQHLPYVVKKYQFSYEHGDDLVLLMPIADAVFDLARRWMSMVDEQVGRGAIATPKVMTNRYLSRKQLYDDLDTLFAKTSWNSYEKMNALLQLPLHIVFNEVVPTTYENALQTTFLADLQPYLSDDSYFNLNEGIENIRIFFNRLLLQSTFAELNSFPRAFDDVDTALKELNYVLSYKQNEMTWYFALRDGVYEKLQPETQATVDALFHGKKEIDKESLMQLMQKNKEALQYAKKEIRDVFLSLQQHGLPKKEALSNSRLMADALEGLGLEIIKTVWPYGENTGYLIVEIDQAAVDNDPFIYNGDNALYLCDLSQHGRVVPIGSIATYRDNILRYERDPLGYFQECRAKDMKNKREKQKQNRKRKKSETPGFWDIFSDSEGETDSSLGGKSFSQSSMPMQSSVIGGVSVLGSKVGQVLFSLWGAVVNFLLRLLEAGRRQSVGREKETVLESNDEQTFQDAYTTQIAFLTDALVANPQDRGAYKERAYLYYSVNRFADAAADFKRYIALQSPEAQIEKDVYYHFGIVSDLSGDYETAIRMFELLLELTGLASYDLCVRLGDSFANAAEISFRVKSIEYCSRALRVYRQAFDRLPENAEEERAIVIRSCAEVSARLAVLYNELGMYKKAAEMLTAAERFRDGDETFKMLEATIAVNNVASSMVPVTIAERMIPSEADVRAIVAGAETVTVLDSQETVAAFGSVENVSSEMQTILSEYCRQGASFNIVHDNSYTFTGGLVLGFGMRNDEGKVVVVVHVNTLRYLSARMNGDASEATFLLRALIASRIARVDDQLVDGGETAREGEKFLQPLWEAIQIENGAYERAAAAVAVGEALKIGDDKERTLRGMGNALRQIREEGWTVYVDEAIVRANVRAYACVYEPFLQSLGFIVRASLPNTDESVAEKSIIVAHAEQSDVVSSTYKGIPVIPFMPVSKVSADDVAIAGQLPAFFALVCAIVATRDAEGRVTLANRGIHAKMATKKMTKQFAEQEKLRYVRMAA